MTLGNRNTKPKLPSPCSRQLLDRGLSFVLFWFGVVWIFLLLEAVLLLLILSHPPGEITHTAWTTPCSGLPIQPLWIAATSMFPESSLYKDADLGAPSSLA